MKEGWKYRKLGEITKTINGLWTGKNPPFINIAVIRNTNFSKDFKLDLTDVAYIDVEQKHYSTRKLIPGDIIIEKSGGSDKQPVGRAILFTIKDGDYSFSNFTSTLRIVDKNLMLPPFLHKYLVAKYKQGVTRAMQAKTTGIHNLDFKAFKNLKVPVPPLAEQQAIVAELDKINQLIALKKSQLANLDLIAQSIFYEMFGDPVENEKGWELSTIGKVAELKSGNSNANNSKPGTLPYVKVGDMNLIGNETYITFSSNYVDRNENFKDIFPIGSIIFPKRGGAILTNKKRITKIEICCDLNVMGVIPNKTLVLPIYIYYYFLRINFKVFAKTGSTIPQINNYNISPMIIPLPPLPLQQAFAERVEVIEKQKEIISAMIKDLETLLASRMQYWFD